MNFFQFSSYFSSEKSCIDFYIKYNLESAVQCPKCHSKHTHRRSDSIKVFQCRKCKNNFSVFRDSMFEKSRTSLNKWYYSVFLYYTKNKRISAKELQATINVTYKTAWRILKNLTLNKETHALSVVFLEAILHVGNGCAPPP